MFSTFELLAREQYKTHHCQTQTKLEKLEMKITKKNMGSTSADMRKGVDTVHSVAQLGLDQNNVLSVNLLGLYAKVLINPFTAGKDTYCCFS